MENTERLSLPMLIAGQAQKELFHNEALQTLDIVVAAAVEEPARDDPPVSPNAGACYLVGENPTGAWLDYAGHLASFSTAGWRFVTPVPGLAVLVKTTEMLAIYGSAGWDVGTVRAARLLVDGKQVVGSQMAAIADPAGGSTVDVEARTILAVILSTLRHHGLIASQ